MSKLNDPLKVEIDDQDREALAYAQAWVNGRLERMTKKDKPQTLLKAAKGLERLREKIETVTEERDRESQKWLQETQELLQKKT